MEYNISKQQSRTKCDIKNILYNLSTKLSSDKFWFLKAHFDGNTAAYLIVLIDNKSAYTWISVSDSKYWSENVPIMLKWFCFQELAKKGILKVECLQEKVKEYIFYEPQKSTSKSGGK